MAEELQELKDRLAELSRSVEELLARQKAEQPPDLPSPPPAGPKD